MLSKAQNAEWQTPNKLSAGIKQIAAIFIITFKKLCYVGLVFMR
jgi:hypothetical protein